MAFSFKKRLAGLSKKLTAKAIQTPVRVTDTETFDLRPLFKAGIGPGWYRSMTLRLSSVHAKVNDDLREGKVSLDNVKNPARFIVNSVALHTIEQMMVSAGKFESLQDLREADWHDVLHKHVESIDL